MSKVTKNQYIKDLEEDRDTLADMVIKLKEENAFLQKDSLSMFNRIKELLQKIEENK